MAVYRVHKTNNFTVMSNIHLRDKELSLKAKGLLSLMLSLPDDWDYSISGLSAIVKEGKKQIKDILSELKEHEYVSITRKNNPTTGLMEYEYDIYETPETQIHAMVNHTMDDHAMVEPYMENGAQINTNNKENTKEQNTNNKKEIEIEDGAQTITADELYRVEDFKELWNKFAKHFNLKQVCTIGEEDRINFQRRQIEFKEHNITSLKEVFWICLLNSVAGVNKGYYVGNGDNKSGWTITFKWLLESREHVERFVDTVEVSEEEHFVRESEVC